jgi:hypothetical protein
MITWEICRQEFAPDGALRDIYILNTNPEHWRKLFKILKSAFELDYRVDGNDQPIPSNVDEIFALNGVTHPLMRFQTAGVTVACHFFSFEQIELDVDPREVNSQTAFDGLISLVKLIGDGLNERVIMTYESDEQHPFISYEPSKSQFVYSPWLTTL